MSSSDKDLLRWKLTTLGLNGGERLLLSRSVQLIERKNSCSLISSASLRAPSLFLLSFSSNWSRRKKHRVSLGTFEEDFWGKLSKKTWLMQQDCLWDVPYLFEEISGSQGNVPLRSKWFLQDIFVHFSSISAVERRLLSWKGNRDDETKTIRNRNISIPCDCTTTWQKGMSPMCWKVI